MRTIIAGTRTATERHTFIGIMSCPWLERVTVVLSGMAAGADTHGAAEARRHGFTVEEYPADWRKHGKAAGMIRNQQMADNADALIAVWDGKSRGTADMIRRAKAKGLRVHVYNYKTGEVVN